MRIGRWSELSVDMVCQEHEVMREADANETSGELGSAFLLKIDTRYCKSWLEGCRCWK